MIFTIGFILFIISYLTYENTEFYNDWRDKLVTTVGIGGVIMMLYSVLSIAWKYLP